MTGNKTDMDMDRILEKITALQKSDEWKEMIDGVLEAKGKGVDFLGNPDAERAVDDLALTTAWIYDTLSGRKPDGRGSMTKKIRKALGYTF